MLVHHLLTLLAFVFASRSAVLRDFQVSQPLTLPQDAKQCTIQILQRTFAFSFGSPEVVQYTPPTDCGPVGSWAGISLNFTVTSNGTQFDRLGIFTFEHVEIWRTSTPEPTRGDGIIWTYLKDVSRYAPLFASPGTFVLQLDNLIQQGLDGEYATTLHATFYASSPKHPPAKHADLIIPVTTLAPNDGDLISVPPAFTLNVTVPRNAVAAYAEIIPSGNGEEEFWVMNVPNQFLGALPDGLTFGFGPFREVRLLVDGMLAGVVFPYLVVFTGGIAPTLWRPIAAYAALDLPTYYIDLTPFIPLLVDGHAHNITLDVLSAEDDHGINQNWFVTANLQVLLDTSDKATSGRMTVHSAEPFAKTTTTGLVSEEGDIDFTVKATRDIRIESDIVSGSGKHTHVVWSQSLAYQNTQTFRQNGTIQTLQQSTKGTFSSTHNGVTTLTDDFTFPLHVDFNFTNPNLTKFATTIDHSYDRDLLPSPFILGTTIRERQQGDASFVLSPTGNFGNGTSQNVFSYVDTDGNTFKRAVSSVNTSITSDTQSGSLAGRQPPGSLDVTLDVAASGFAAPRLPGSRRVNMAASRGADEGH